MYGSDCYFTFSKSLVANIKADVAYTHTMTQLGFAYCMQAFLPDEPVFWQQVCEVLSPGPLALFDLRLVCRSAATNVLPIVLGNVSELNMNLPRTAIGRAKLILFFEGMTTLKTATLTADTVVPPRNYNPMLDVMSSLPMTACKLRDCGWNDSNVPSVNMSSLSALTRLVSLRMESFNSVDSLNVLTTLSQLTHLQLYQFQSLQSTDFLSSLTALKVMECCNCSSAQQQPLSLITNTCLTSVEFSHCLPRNVQPSCFAHLTGLSSLNISSACPTDINPSPLTALKSLKHLNMGGHLHLQEAGVDALIVNLTQLTSLNLAWCFASRRSFNSHGIV